MERLLSLRVGCVQSLYAMTARSSAILNLKKNIYNCRAKKLYEKNSNDACVLWIGKLQESLNHD